MKKSIDNQLDKVNLQVEKSLIYEAQDLLKTIDSSPLSEKQLALYNLLLGQINIRTSLHGFERPLKLALEYYGKNKETELYRRTKYFCSWIPFSKGKYTEAIESLVESYGDFRRNNEIRWMMRALNQLANVCQLTGAIVTSIDYLEKCVELNKQLPDASSVPACMTNIATVYYLSGYFQQAISRYKEILPKINQITIERRRHFYFNYGMATAMHGDIKLGISLLKKAKMLSGFSSRGNIYYQEFLSWIRVIDGKYSEAEKSLLKCLDNSMKEAPSSGLILRVKRLLAEAYLGQNKYSSAEKLAREALEISKKINRRVEIAACHRILARIEYHKGNNRKSREWYDRAIDEFSYISSRYELNNTRYIAAISGPYNNGERSALLYQALDYFRSEKMDRDTKKVELELKRLTGQFLSIETTARNGPVYLAAAHKSKKITELARDIAASSITILLTGPTGSGKDQLARYIHHFSEREGQFVSINSAAIPDGMIEAELFGYQKGAYTGASKNRRGLFEEANRGTLYLNEIAESTPAFQAKLLEAIETRTIRHLGANKPISINIRIIASTNRDLRSLIREGGFREDLYHRLHEIQISLPPLSQRAEDIPLLAKHFLLQNGLETDDLAMSEDFLQLCKYFKKRDWPGNIRELRAEINRLYHLARGNIKEMLRMVRQELATERDIILTTLQNTDWNKSAAARILNVTEGTVRYRIKKYSLSRNSS